ncbi:MAG: ribonuclease D [Proteobacteria bacterium]|nr:ribonuclease D [Pseudomonadota bacterium]
MNNSWIWVDNYRKIDRANNDIKSSDIVCIDTEYDSFRYFREKLCLIQIKTENMTYLLDPLNTLDLSFLGSTFSDPDIVKIVHAGDNDIRILRRDYGFEFKNIFDTQKAASLLGCRYLSLESVIFQHLGIELNKSKKMQRSRWENRPLTEEQISYAVQDTQYLADLYVRLKGEIKQNGWGGTASRAFEEIASVRWREKILDPHGYLKIKGAKELNKRPKRRLNVLFRWRFQKAKETNTARLMILSDQTLVDLSKSEIHSIESLEKVCKLPPKKVKLFGQEIIEILNNS